MRRPHFASGLDEAPKRRHARVKPEPRDDAPAQQDEKVAAGLPLEVKKLDDEEERKEQEEAVAQPAAAPASGGGGWQGAIPGHAECRICMAARKTHLLQPCRHYRFCEGCASAAVEKGICPYCSVAVVEA